MIKPSSHTQLHQPAALSLSLRAPPLHAPHNLRTAVGQSEHANPQHRPAMEDEMVALSFDTFPGLFLAVYDGHGGKLAATLVRDHLHCLFLDELLTDEQDPSLTSRASSSSAASDCSTPPYDMSDDPDVDMAAADALCTHPANTVHLDVKSAFLRAYARMDLQLRTRNCLCVGTTAVTLFLRRVPKVGRILTAANCGDARAVLSRAGRALRLSFDHRPVDVEERARVESCGGFVSCRRINGVLNVSRALGDHSLKSVVVSTPYLNEVMLSDMDDFVILACDGLWDVMQDQQAICLAQNCFDRGLDVNETAAVLVKEAIDLGTTDNVSVMVAQFDIDDDDDE